MPLVKQGHLSHPFMYDRTGIDELSGSSTPFREDSLIRHTKSPGSSMDTWMVSIASVLIVAALMWSAASIRSTRRSVVGSDESAGALVAPLPDVPLFTEVLSVTDAVVHAGAWFVLDGRARRIHRFDFTGRRLVSSFARRGEGPGELRSPVAIAVLTDTLAVVESAGDWLHLYSPDGLHLGDRPVRFGGCPSRAARDLASTQWGLLVLLDCMTESGREAQTLLEGTGGRFHAIAAYAPRQTGPRVVDPTLLPVVAAHPRGFLFGLAGEECLDLYGPEGDVLEPVCHGWIERYPLPQAVANSVLELGRRSARRRGPGHRAGSSPALRPDLRRRRPIGVPRLHTPRGHAIGRAGRSGRRADVVGPARRRGVRPHGIRACRLGRHGRDSDRSLPTRRRLTWAGRGQGF